MTTYEEMKILWKKAPAAVVAGLAHPFYRSEVLAWLDDFLFVEGSDALAKNLAVEPASEHDPFWALGSAAPAVLAAIADLDHSRLRMHNELRAALLDLLVMRGLLLCPLRGDLDPVRRLDLAEDTLGVGAGSWCGGAKAPDGRLFFLPHASNPTSIALVFSPSTGHMETLDVSDPSYSKAAYNGASPSTHKHPLAHTYRHHRQCAHFQNFKTLCLLYCVH